MDDLWGAFISLQLSFILLWEAVKFIRSRNKPKPLTMSQVFMIIDTLDLNNKAIEKLVIKLGEENSHDLAALKNYIFEEIRRKEKRDFDNGLQDKNKKDV